MKKKSLIIISFDFPPLSGGIARLCQEIAVGQLNNFKEMIVCTTDKRGESITYNYDKIHRIEFPSDRIKCEFAMIRYLKSIPNPENVVVLTATWHPEGLIGYLSNFSKLFILAHGTELLHGSSWFRKNIWLKFYAPFLLNKATGIIANSNYTARLVRHLGESARCHVLPLAVNENFFKPLIDNKPDDETLVLASVSRIERFKGHDFILHTISKLPSLYKNRIRWNIAGTGPDLEYLKDLVREMNLDHLITFHGFVTDSDLPKFYNNSDVFILCSREAADTTTVEGFGLVFLEAQSCGVPAIGTKSGGIPDAISHENGGWLIDQDDEQQLVALIIRLIEDRGYLKEQGRLARKRVEESCTWSKYNEDLYKILKGN